MYVPILRKLNDAVRQIKSADPDSVISRYFIECLIDKKVLHPIMYGDSWMINLDELFFYLQGIAPPSLTAHQQQSTINRHRDFSFFLDSGAAFIVTPLL